MFTSLWYVIFDIVELILTFGSMVVNYFTTPLMTLISDSGLDDIFFLLKPLILLFEKFVGDVTLIEFMLTSGLLAYILISLINWFKNVIVVD